LIADDIIERTKVAVEESDLLIWLVEYDKFTQLDDAILKMLRGKNIPPVIVVANKADNENMVMESYSLPVVALYPDFFPVSVVHNRGLNELRECISKNLKSRNLDYKVEELDDSFIKMSMVGRPNVGKSSLINAIV